MNKVEKKITKTFLLICTLLMNIKIIFVFLIQRKQCALK